MKFVIAKSELTHLIGKIQNIVSSKGTIPILNNFMLEAGDDEIILTATDLTVGLKCYTPAKVLQKGATTLPARKFFQLIRELTAANLEIACSQNQITEIFAGSSRFKMNGMAKNEYPSLPSFEGSRELKIPAKLLKEMLYKTSFSVSKEESRFTLTGALLKFHQGKMTIVGTDGKRLARAESTIDVDASFSHDYILPIKAVEEVQRVFEGEEGVLTLFLAKDKIAFESGSAMLMTKLLSGEYPDFTRVIPKKCAVDVSLHREELSALLRQLLLFTSDPNNSVRFTFLPGELVLSANQMDVGEGKVSMPVNYQGAKLEIAFNPTYFLDILRHSNEETIKLGLTDAYNPGVITDSSNALYILMPMRLGDE